MPNQTHDITARLLVRATVADPTAFPLDTKAATLIQEQAARLAQLEELVRDILDPEAHDHGLVPMRLRLRASQLLANAPEASAADRPAQAPALSGARAATPRPSAWPVSTTSAAILWRAGYNLGVDAALAELHRARCAEGASIVQGMIAPPTQPWGLPRFTVSGWMGKWWLDRHCPREGTTKQCVGPWTIRAEAEAVARDYNDASDRVERGEPRE